MKDVTDKIDMYLTEDNTLNKIGSIAKKKNLVDMRGELEKIFKKKDIDFSFSPVAHFRIKHKGKTIIIVNKKYAEGGELIVGKISIGYE